MFHARASLLGHQKIGGQPIGVVRVVVVAAAVVVDIPKIRRIRDIGRTQPPVIGENYRKQPVYLIRISHGRSFERRTEDGRIR